MIESGITTGEVTASKSNPKSIHEGAERVNTTYYIEEPIAEVQAHIAAHLSQPAPEGTMGARIERAEDIDSSEVEMAEVNPNTFIGLLDHHGRSLVLIYGLCSSPGGITIDGASYVDPPRSATEWAVSKLTWILLKIIPTAARRGKLEWERGFEAFIAARRRPAGGEVT